MTTVAVLETHMLRNALASLNPPTSLIGRVPIEVFPTRLVPASVELEEEETRQAYFGEPWGFLETPVLSRAEIGTGLDGPILVDEYDSTIVVPPHMRAYLDESKNLILEPVDGRG